jgi:hypothetical protein
VVKCLTIALRIWEVQGSNTSLEAGYPDRFSLGFLGPCRKMPGSYLKLGHDRFMLHPLYFIIHPSPFYSTLNYLSS